MAAKKFFGTSSSSDKIWKHGYQRFYPIFLDRYQSVPCNLLEIGVHQKESINLWMEYLPYASLTGIDIDYYDSNEKVKMVQLDQSKRDELEHFASLNKNEFDIIVDDGSHVPKHQLKTVQCLWSCLKQGGVYIIEDIETSYWKRSTIYGYRFDSRFGNPIRTFKAAVDHINRRYSGQKIKGFTSEIESVTFGENCIILVKRSDEFEQYYSAPYPNWFEVNRRGLFYWPKRLLRRLLSSTKS